MPDRPPKCCSFCAPELGVHCKDHCGTPVAERPLPIEGVGCKVGCDPARGFHYPNCLSPVWFQEELVKNHQRMERDAHAP